MPLGKGRILPSRRANCCQKYGLDRLRPGRAAGEPGETPPKPLQNSYGPNKYINSLKPFDVESKVDAAGALTIQLQQDQEFLRALLIICQVSHTIIIIMRRCQLILVQWVENLS